MFFKKCKNQPLQNEPARTAVPLDYQIIKEPLETSSSFFESLMEQRKILISSIAKNDT
jgi:hypothetical protein